MTHEAFVALLEKRIDTMRSVLAKKAEEYASDNDRLHNFKKAAAISRRKPSQALFGMLVKHLVSIVDLVEGDRPMYLATIDEKIGDAINYLVLLEALLKE